MIQNTGMIQKQKHDTKTGMIQNTDTMQNKHDTKPQAYWNSDSNSKNFNYPAKSNFVVVMADWYNNEYINIKEQYSNKHNTTNKKVLP